ncbi:MAG: NADH-quinone oxidoreductase subunit M [Clostridia bacterium]|nr:NADH-quinone oxidoreductase subunit M [Deltaproteobacteria bacterium]
MGFLEQHLLTAIVFLPLAGALICLAFPRGEHSGVRGFALTIATFDLVLACWLWSRYAPGTSGMQLVEKVEWIPSLGISYTMGVDGVAVILILLTTFLLPIVVLSTYSSVEERSREFMVCLLFLQTGMLGAFAATDLFLFYTFYEIMLVPMYFLVGIWGGRNRIYAALKFFIYTMAGSLLMLVAIIYTVWAVRDQGGLTFDWATVTERIANANLGGVEVFLFLAFAIAFAIKVPMFPFHTWLPDAHVEAPTAGSVILAGVLLKVGTFGYLRYALWMFPKAAVLFLPTIGILAVIGIIYGALVAMVQADLKRLVAYSSVSHLGFVMLGLVSMTVTGVSGSVLQMVNHGISSGALFLLVGVIYERRHTRLLEDFGGLAKVMPRYAFAFVLLALSSAGLPGLNGFVGEFMIVMGSYQAQGPTMEVTNGTLATYGIILAGVTGLAAVAIMFFKVLGAEQREHMSPGQRVAAVVMVALLALLVVAPPVGGFHGGLLIRPLYSEVSSTESFREIFALLTVFAATGVIFAAVYLLIAVQKVFFGPIRHAENEGLSDLSFREQAVLFPLALTAILMGVFPQPFLNVLNPTVQSYTAQFRQHASLPALALVVKPRASAEADSNRRMPANLRDLLRQRAGAATDTVNSGAAAKKSVAHAQGAE